MLSYQHLLFSLLVAHLLPCSLATAIPDGPDVGSTPAPELSDRSTPTVLPLVRWDEGFVEWLNAQTSDTNSGVSQRLRQNIEIEPTTNPLVDGFEAAGSLGLSSRDTEANSSPDTAADVGRSPNAPGIFPRGDGPYAETSFDEVAKNMKTLNTDDQKCGARAASAPRLTSSSLGIKKRVPNPSDCLWNAALAACVDRGASNYLPWAG